MILRFLQEYDKKKWPLLNSTGVHFFCAQCGRPLAHVTHDLCCAAPQQNPLKPLPERERTSVPADAVIKDRLAVVSAANRLTGDVLDESSAGAPLQRWHPLGVTQFFPHKTLFVQPCKGKKRKKSPVKV